MRVGINASFLRKPSTGIGQVTRHFLEELSKNPDVVSKPEGEDVEFIVYLEEALPAGLRLSSRFSVRAFLPFLWKRDDLIRKMLWEKVSLPRRAKADGCDVLLSLYQSATVAPKGTRHVMLVHDIIPRIFPEYLNNSRKRTYQRLIEAAIKKADKIAVVSAYTRNDLVAQLGIMSRDVSVCYVDVDPLFRKSVSIGRAHDVMRKYHLHPGYIYLGGGLEKRKNAEGLLYAYAALLKTNKKQEFIHDMPKLVISGKLMPELAPLIVDVEALVKQLNLTGQVKILGFVPQEELPALYKQALFFVFPSLYEGFGLPVLEAMSQGTPVLTSHTTSLPEVGADTVMYCDPSDVSDMARALRKLLLDKEYRAALGARGKVRSQEFSWGKFAKRIARMV
ncbi:MAG: glycosyltransferase family 1 protein [Candidatus Moranbacteria bacterium]|nr:glycosyltransferase family 1 protein [Candidatus Moranbacteria bacterium]